MTDPQNYDRACELKALRSENADLRKALHDRYDVTAKLVAERDQLRARVAELDGFIKASDEIYAAQVEDMRRQHDARVTELLEADNREVERRRRAEAAMRTPSPDPRTQGWFLFAANNSDAMQALIEGRAAVVPLHFVNAGMSYIVYGVCGTIPLCNVRLDKPVEDK